MIIEPMVLSTLLAYLPTTSKDVETHVFMDISQSDFCHYVEIFSLQVARNKIRNVPFSRLSEFSYFTDRYSEFLETTATEIYEREDMRTSSLESLSAEYRDRCDRKF